jgi:hypothetical protein
VSGTGNLDLVNAVTAPDLSAFKAYDPKVSGAVLNSGSVVGGGKSWEYILMPRSPGNVTIGPFRLSFFDPGNGKYHTVETKTIDLRVTPGDAVSSGSSGSQDGRDGIAKIADDIRYIKPDMALLVNSNRKIYGSAAFYLVYLLSLGLFFAAFMVKRRRDAIERNTGLKRQLAAWKKTSKRLEEADRLKNDGDQARFYGELSDAITEYIGDRLNIDTGPLTRAGLQDTLVARGVDRELAERTSKTLELCDFFRFSSTGSQQDMRERLIGDARDILSNLRQVL